MKRMFVVIRVITVIVLIILCIQVYPFLNPQNIRLFLKENGTVAPLIFIVLCIFRPVLFFLPSMGLTIVAGLLFGYIWGTIYVTIGGAFSTIVGFYFARWLGRDIVKRFAGMNKRIEQMDTWTNEQGKNVVLSMRLFNLPWDMVSYWAGLSGIKFKDFYIASIITLLPISFLYTYFGSKALFPTSSGFIISLSIIFILGAMPYIKMRWKKRKYG